MCLFGSIVELGLKDNEREGTASNRGTEVHSNTEYFTESNSLHRRELSWIVQVKFGTSTLKTRACEFLKSP